jgi:ribonuclease Z
MDHFIGFDALLRRVLGRERELTVTGPAGFLRHVAGRIAGYTWNVIERYPVRLVVEEIDGASVESVAYTGASRMRPEPLGRRPWDGVVAGHRAYTIHAGTLDHGVPVLGVVLAETEHLSVDKDRMARLGLEPGPWLADLKNDVRRAAPADEPVQASAALGVPRTFRRGDLASEILFRTPGQRIAYLTDLRCTADNVRRAVDLVRGVDLLVCEAAFLHEDEALARERNHLTARQAGELARDAGAARLAPFHVSPRYAGRTAQILAEAGAAFGGPIVALAAGPR